MIKSNTFYLFLVAIFLILSALSFYWFNNVDSYTDTHSAKNNSILETGTNIWYKFNAVISFLNIIGDNSNNNTEKQNIDILDNPIEKSASVLSSFEIKDQTVEELKYQEESTSSGINDLIVKKEVNEKKWYKKYSQWVSSKGLYTYKKDNKLEINWNNFQGKTYSISIPY